VVLGKLRNKKGNRSCALGLADFAIREGCEGGKFFVGLGGASSCSVVLARARGRALDCEAPHRPFGAKVVPTSFEPSWHQIRANYWRAKDGRRII
jgi:hypothetical protein